MEPDEYARGETAIKRCGADKRAAANKTAKKKLKA
jgi:hypothetical protein